ncbi:MAG: NADP-binding protein [Clostridiales bacterium]|nr:NADP-binding protein [Clostridiales bacterium]
MRKVRVAVWGFGAMGSGMARVLLQRKGVELAGVCDQDPGKAGRSVYDLLGLERAGREDVVVSADIDQVLALQPLDICLIATNSFVKEVFPKIIRVVERGINVLTIAEEMAWPWVKEPELARQMDEQAREKGVSVLGTGINPGLMMDLLAVFLSGCMTEVSHVRCERVNSLSPFGKAVMVDQGIGMTPEAFAEGVQNGTLAGHVGFVESAGMIASALGLPVDRFQQQMLPILTRVDRRSAHGFAAAGQVAGVNMTAQAHAGDQELIHLIHPQQIEPHLADVETGDYVTLTGTPPVNMAIQPEVDGGVGTIAMACNMLPFVVAARPGLLSMLDLPVPRCVMGDYRDIAFGGSQHG